VQPSKCAWPWIGIRYSKSLACVFRSGRAISDPGDGAIWARTESEKSPRATDFNVLGHGSRIPSYETGMDSAWYQSMSGSRVTASGRDEPEIESV
jgi:hypothetical protein